jgi:hypothetical protein
MKKFSKLFESSTFNKEDIETINDILKYNIDWDDKETIHIEKYSSEGIDNNDINKILINITLKDGSYENDFFNEIKKYTDDILNIVSHLKSIGKVYHDIDINQENRYFGGDYSEIKMRIKIIIKA